LLCVAIQTAIRQEAAEDSVKLIVLGCGDAFGSGGRNFSAFLFTDGRRHFLIDCGPSALPALKSLGLDPRDVRGMIISHCHGDHFGGIPYFFIDFQFLSSRSEPLLLAGPTGLQARCERLLHATYPDVLEIHRWAFPIDYRELSAGQVMDADGLQVEAFEMEHGTLVPALGYRIRWEGVVLGYTGDTKWNSRIPELARGCDLLLCECFFFDEAHHSHVRYRDLVEHRSEIQAKRVVLFHLGPPMFQELPRVDLEVARDGMVIELGA
jgi:ribonuclease BN (tRNA processing enzyme)